MTEIVVARRNGVLREPDGTAHRMHRGKTLADARHPAVLANPDAFVPMPVELSVEPESFYAAEVVVEPEAVAKLREEMTELEETLDGYLGTFALICDGLRERGVSVVPGDEGWLAELVLATIDRARGTTPSPIDVPPPAPSRVKPAPATAPRKPRQAGSGA